MEVVKREHESVQHVLMKAMLWAMHVDQYPQVEIERPIGDRYTPDCISLHEGSGEPLFWGECGRVELSKIESIAERFQRAHFVFAKWSINPIGFAATVRQLVADGRPVADDGKAALFGPIEVVSIPEDCEERFFQPLGGDHSAGVYVVTPDRAQLQWVRVWYPDISEGV